MKPIGWRYESHRHALAARGVKTRYMALKDNLDWFKDLDKEERVVQAYSQDVDVLAAKQDAFNAYASSPEQFERSSFFAKRKKACPTCGKWHDHLHGGKADKMQPWMFKKASLKEGMTHEMEHTTNKKIATEIAMDHLAEDPKYYKKLKRIET